MILYDPYTMKQIDIIVTKHKEKSVSFEGKTFALYISSQSTALAVGETSCSGKPTGNKKCLHSKEQRY